MATIDSFKIYKGLDVMKLTCAFLIVYLHSFLHDLGIVGQWIYESLSLIGVPFFFITSGFLYSKKLYSNKLSFNYFKKYNTHLIKMYIVWTIITLPVSWLCIEWGHGEFSLLMKIIYLFRMIFFSGSCGIYWYILSLILCSLIIYLFIKNGQINLLYIIAAIFFLLGVWYGSPYNNVNIFFKFVHVVFGSERNFINFGLFYMCIGHYLERHPVIISKLHLLIVFVVVIIFRSFEIKVFHLNCLPALLAIILFLFAYNWNPQISIHQSFILRKWSTAVYLIHFPFLLVYDYFLSRDTITGFTLAIIFSLLLYYILKKTLNDYQLKILFG